LDVERLVLVLLGVALISLGIFVASIPSIASVRLKERLTVELARNVTVEPGSRLYLWIPFREGDANISTAVSVEGGEIGFEAYFCPGKSSGCIDDVDWFYGRNTHPCSAMQLVVPYRRVSSNFSADFRAYLRAPYYIMLDNTFSQTPKNVTLVLRLTWSEDRDMLEGFRYLGAFISAVGVLSILLGLLLPAIRGAAEKTRRWLAYSLCSRVCLCREEMKT